MFQLCACHSDIPQYNSSETFRNVPLLLSHVCPAALSFDGYTTTSVVVFLGGDKRDRTADLLTASQALSQLSYTPM